MTSGSSNNWIQVFLGIWLIVSPWLLGFSSISVMKWSNVFVGLILTVMNIWIIFGKIDVSDELNKSEHHHK